ncbi:hypothetical protein P3342_005036 [Pyrenophora teres f. teres]|nr:hypothetical protein P3342_005036 [Pyrenophora teres f. teres]
MAPDSDTIVVQLPEDLRTSSTLDDEMETDERHQDNPTTPIEQTTQETPRDFLRARNTYNKAIKDAKRKHWNEFLEKEDPQSIYKAMAYTKDNKVERIPPIQGETSFDKKCQAFRNTLFPPPPITEAPTFTNYQEKRWIGQHYPRLN